MDFLSFLIEVEAITASGALSPGPLTFATMSSGVKGGWRAGFMVAVGHMIVEFPLVALLGLGLKFASENIYVKLPLLLIGGSVLIFMGLQEMARSRTSVLYADKPLIGGFKSGLLVGVSLTGANPYFIVWWLTVGSTIIFDSLSFGGLNGVFLMFLMHIWMDYAFLILVAYLAFRGVRRLGGRGYKFTLICLGAVLIFFGGKFLFDGLNLLF